MIETKTEIRGRVRGMCERGMSELHGVVTRIHDLGLTLLESPGRHVSGTGRDSRR